MDKSMAEFLGAQAVVSATPLMLAGIGETISQRAGVINIGIEGMMLSGALGAFLGAMHGGGIEGIFLAGAAGMMLAGIFALATIWFRADQIVAGCALNLLAAGGVGTAWEMYDAHLKRTGVEMKLADGAAFERWAIPGLSNIPVVGPVFFSQFVLTYMLIALALAVWAAMNYTRVLLIVRALF
jgi:simple sugar transport system permease protein